MVVWEELENLQHCSKLLNNRLSFKSNMLYDTVICMMGDTLDEHDWDTDIRPGTQLPNA